MGAVGALLKIRLVGCQSVYSRDWLYTRPAIFAMLFGAVKIPPQNGLAANRIHN